MYSERILPYALVLAKALESELLLLSVPALPEGQDYRAAPEIVGKIRHQAENNMMGIADGIQRSIRLFLLVNPTGDFLPIHIEERWIFQFADFSDLGKAPRVEGTAGRRVNRAGDTAR